MCANRVYVWRHLVKATEVTAGLAESTGSLPPSEWGQGTRCKVPVHRNQLRAQRSVKLAFHGADTDTDFLADILTRIVARMSACIVQLATGITSGNRVSDVSARILARMSVSVSESWKSSLMSMGELYLFTIALKKPKWR